MKIRVVAAVAGLTCLAASGFGATVVSYTATADPNSSPDGMDSLGNMVDVWTLTHTGEGTSPNNYGSFLGNSGNNGGGSGAGAGTSAWGLYANGATTASDNEVDITHAFDGGALTLGQSVSINFDGAYVDNDDQYGLRLLGTNNSFVFALSFIGGGSNYSYYDASPNGQQTIGYDPNGFTFTFTLTGTTTYAATITDSTGTLDSFTGSISGAPTSIQVYNNNAGSGANYDVYSNNLDIVPEPNSYALVGAGFGLALMAWLRARHSSGARA